jgi:histone H3/H4
MEVTKMSEMIIIKSKVKDVAEGCNVASDFAEALSDQVCKLLEDAEKRCEENKRSTVMPKDLAMYFISPQKCKEMIIVKSKVKENIKNCNVSSELGDALNCVACHMVKKACERCQANKRSTVQPRDL